MLGGALVTVPMRTYDALCLVMLEFTGLTIGDARSYRGIQHLLRENGFGQVEMDAAMLHVEDAGCVAPLSLRGWVLLQPPPWNLPAPVLVAPKRRR